MDNKLLELIDDIEILLKQDERFFLSNDHKYRNKIKKLASSEKNFNAQPIDITPLVNFAKLQGKQQETIVVKEQVETQTYNTESLRNIIARLSELNNKMDNIVD